jgi:cyclopropane fatty-acyl-phospholipid synthase-like methyltransferase
MAPSVYVDKYEFEYNGDLPDAMHRVGSNNIFELGSQTHFMLENGLKPEHKFLDLGCGCLRGTLYLVDYVNDGNYYGADVSKGLLAAAADYAKKNEVIHKPNLIHIDGFDGRENLFAEKFDFILSVSLLTHILPEDLESLFGLVKKILKKDGRFFFTIIPTTSEDFSGDVELMRYRKEYIAKAAQRAGLAVYDRLTEYPNEVPYFKIMPKVNHRGIGQWMLEAVHE